MGTFRYIGYLMGVEDAENVLADFTKSVALKQSLDVYMLHPTKESAHMTKVVLKSFECKPPYYLSFRHHVQLTRLLMGEKLANELQLPYKNTGLDISLQLKMLFQNFTLNLMLWFHREQALLLLESKVLSSYKYILKGAPSFQFKECNDSSDFSVQLVGSFRAVYLSKASLSFAMVCLAFSFYFIILAI
ncbi:hypothetical protein DSO57_1001718 [Entomophthora muscae]|uniref:Uncharacterized protein n=1 Tax=Entomophthora muscae TaxID=34485 RepID=A0ACC2SLQ5_9FUNG|nr:hypothetical protein DSO57_1001718 [Entomophthora muscae]